MIPCIPLLTVKLDVLIVREIAQVDLVIMGLDQVAVLKGAYAGVSLRHDHAFRLFCAWNCRRKGQETSAAVWHAG